MRGRWRGLAGVVVAAAALLTASPARAATPTPSLTLTPIDAAAGYFLAQGSCGVRGDTLSFTWTNAPNGVGWGQTAMRTDKTGAFSVPLRMQASAPGQTISVKARCWTPRGRVAARWALDVVSGNALLADPPANSGTGRRIVYSLSAQELWAIDADGTVAHTHLVSGRRLEIAGGKSQLGVFSVFRKRREGCRGGTCINFVSFHMGLNGDMGFHQIPFNRHGPYETDTELGQPRSHGCVRQSKANAAWLYEWAVVGDPVYVVP